jgi:hypothetical protein
MVDPDQWDDPDNDGGGWSRPPRNMLERLIILPDLPLAPHFQDLLIGEEIGTLPGPSRDE